MDDICMGIMFHCLFKFLYYKLCKTADDPSSAVLIIIVIMCGSIVHDLHNSSKLAYLPEGYIIVFRITKKRTA